jgi:hypothetical protein
MLAAVLGASALGVGACGPPAPTGDADPPPPVAVADPAGPAAQAAPATAVAPAATAAQATVVAAPAAAGPSSPRGWRRCVNTAQDYSIGYPRGWHTTQIRPAEACAQFHPSRFTIPPESEYPLTALNARRVPAPPSRADTEFERTLLWQRTTVNGRHAVRFETVSTGAGLHLAGTRQYGYVVRLGRGLISVHTTAEPGETRYAAWKTVTDKAVRTLSVAPRTPAHRGCAPVRPDRGFYEGGRVATAPLTTPVSRCSTISVSHVRDPADPADRCQTFRVGFWPLVDGALTYTEPVTACGTRRTVLARDVPDHAEYLVLYDVDDIDPDVQTVTFKVWH